MSQWKCTRNLKFPCGVAKNILQINQKDAKINSLEVLIIETWRLIHSFFPSNLAGCQNTISIEVYVSAAVFFLNLNYGEADAMFL